VTSVSQIGTDRIIEFQFSGGQYRLFLEFYAAGNIVLTDAELTVLSLLRNVTEGAEHEQLKVGVKYNLLLRQNYAGIPPLSKERIKDGLQRAVDKRQQADAKSTKKSERKETDALRKALSTSMNEFPPPLLDHAFSDSDFDATKRPEDVLQSEALLDQLLSVLQEAQKIVAQITGSEVVKGYVVAKKARGKGENTEADASQQHPEPVLVYDDFQPFQPKQFENDPNVKFLEFQSFNKAVDEFYSSIEGQRLESRLHEREEVAKKKLEQVRKDHENRIGGLQQVQELNIRKAEAIQANVERVEEVTAAVNGLIAQGMDWVDIGRLIEAEQGRGNPVAQLIKLPLKLHENAITLMLGEAEAADDDSTYGTIRSDTESEISDSEAECAKPSPKPTEEMQLAVDIDLSLSAWANASQYYDQKKTAAVKEEKTMQASTKAMKNAEQKIAKDLKRDLTQEKDVLRPVRKQFWFEKFYYFISSDGYLVVAGKDALQNELLYRRYLKNGDVYVHADLNGAPPIIIKNNPSTPDAPIPPSTLSQAGTLAVSASSAWDSKASMSAWWVNADQVSKTAPTGEYLTTGAFMIREKKNFLPPTQLILGFAIMFQISDESKARHLRHRVENVDVPTNDEHNVADDEPVIEDEPHTELIEAKDPSEEISIRNAETEVKDVEDSDEDFPDAKLDLGQDESDDEDFPDAKFVQMDDESDEDAKTGISNPLQTGLRWPMSTEDVKQTPSEGEQFDLPQESESAEVKKVGNRHLSAHERRLRKKGIDPSSASRQLDEQHIADESAGTTDNDQTSQSASAIATPTGKPKSFQRGKRGKAKKAAKYADQDEEDRELAMRLLGSRSGQKQAEAAAAARKAKEEQEAAQKQRRREQHLRNQATGKAAEEARRAVFVGKSDATADDADGTEQNEAANDEAIRLELIELNALIGQPLPGDELLAALPVCAPWAALATYKYKTKMQPGTVKKGKAIKEILGKWQADVKDGKKVDQHSQDVEKIWPREAELIKGIRETEVIGVVPVGKVRVVAGAKDVGGSGTKGKAKAKAARGGKGSKKQR
jgi:predicted ribosome quality control (RQC) complex YloA/Tae2 family protein